MTQSKGLDHWADILVITIYLVAVISVGLWTLCRPNRGNTKSYFLASRSMPWFAVGASLFSSNIGSEHFVGLAGAGASSGIALACFELFTTSLFLILGWFFLPVYISAGVYTLPEYMEKRHGGKRIRLYLSCFALVLYVITKLAVSIFAGSLFIQLSLGWNMYPSIAVLLAITGLYTVLGGLTAVMYTDTFQTAVMTLGAFVVVGYSYNKVGGYSAIQEKYSNAVPPIRIENSTCGEPRSDAFHLFRDPETGDYPWPGIVLQATIGCLWYVCCDQVMVQRSLAAKNISHAKGGSVLAASLKLLPLYLILFPGMISRILFPDEVACVDPEECIKYCENSVGCSNIAYPKLVMGLLPVGLRGLLMAVMMSAIMSSLTSIFNSSGTIFTMDIWRRIRSRASQRELLIVGRIFVIFMCGISILWIPVVKSANEGKLFTYMTAVESYLGTPLGVLFLMSMFWKRTTEAAVFWGMVIAHIFGGVRLVLEMVFTAPLCGEEETRPPFLYKLHYLYFAQIELVFTVIVVIVISLFTKRRSEEELTGVTWWTRHKFSKTDNIQEEADPTEIPMDNGTTEEIGIEGNTKVVIETVNTENGTGKLKHIFHILFGIQNTEETTDFDVNDRKTFVKESKVTKRILNTSTIILMGIVVFLIGVYH